MALMMASFCALAAAGAFYLASWHELESLKRAEAVAPVAMSGAPKQQIPTAPVLNKFVNTHLLNRLREGAAIADVLLDEITLSIESPAGQPFLRYRASFNIKAGYPAIRKFTSQILAGTDSVVLDKVSCTREDIKVADVKCDFGVYIPYQRDGRG